jgi:hypothetical protein
MNGLGIMFLTICDLKIQKNAFSNRRKWIFFLKKKIIILKHSL